jgi:hypothetical protein
VGGLGGVTAGIAGFRNLLARGMWVPGGGRRCWRMSGLIRRRVWPGFFATDSVPNLLQPTGAY